MRTAGTVSFATRLQCAELYKIRIRNIAASELQDNYTVSFTIGGTAYSVTYSPMNYCYKVQNGGSDDTKLQKVVKALYRYSQVANVYFSED